VYRRPCNGKSCYQSLTKCQAWGMHLTPVAEFRQSRNTTCYSAMRLTPGRFIERGKAFQSLRAITKALYRI
ncbi:MAG: hypothetical protein ACRD4A_10165, partial [Candidatus Acidiferrales bacterium]